MEIRELSEKQIAENIENYQPIYEKNVKRGRRNLVHAAAGLVFIYLYLRLFNTAYIVEDYKYPQMRVVYSTAWVVNCPADEVDGKKVDRVVILGLEDCPYAREIKVEEGIEEIWFGGYPSTMGDNPLRKVELPSTLQWMASECFQNCTNLKTVKWEQAGEDAYIGMSAFYNTGLEEIRIPDGVTRIEDGVFRFNRNLKTAVLPDSLSEMGGELFWNCPNLEEVTWSKGQAHMPRQTFLGCENLKVLKNTDSLRSIHYTALLGTQITAEQLPENVYCYNKSDVGVGPDIADALWLADYKYTYDAEDEKQFLQERYGLPAEVLELEAEDGRFWLGGDYYHLDMTLEEFVATGDWEIDDIDEGKEKDEYSFYTLERKDGEEKYRVYLYVNDGEIMEYGFYSDYLQLVLPDVVSNKGMSKAKILDRPQVEEGNSYKYDWEYTSAGEKKKVKVELRFDYYRDGCCDIWLYKEGDIKE